MKKKGLENPPVRGEVCPQRNSQNVPNTFQPGEKEKAVPPKSPRKRLFGSPPPKKGNRGQKGKKSPEKSLIGEGCLKKNPG